MKQFLIFLFIASGSLIGATVIRTMSAFDDLAKLQGLWAMKTKKGLMYEEWSRHSKDELRSHNFRLNGKDTLTLERVRLINRGDGIFYLPVVEDQNNGEAVPFKLVDSETNRFIFENPAHDFPQRIIYHFITADSVVARIEGTKEGKSMGSNYYFKRQ